eukprot:scaffold650237_cov38-Prasinocladus_malaysianus.AAC.1
MEDRVGPHFVIVDDGNGDGGLSLSRLESKRPGHLLEMLPSHSTPVCGVIVDGHLAAGSV